MNQKHSGGPSCSWNSFINFQNWIYLFFIISYLSVSILVFINSFPNAKIPGLPLRMTSLGEELRTVAFIFSFLAALRAVCPKPSPAHREIWEDRKWGLRGPCSAEEECLIESIKENPFPKSKTLCKSTWLVGRASTAFQLPLSFTAYLPYVGYSLYNHIEEPCFSLLSCDFHGESFENNNLPFSSISGIPNENNVIWRPQSCDWPAKCTELKHIPLLSVPALSLSELNLGKLFYHGGYCILQKRT